MAFNFKLRREIFRNLGACMSPFAAYLQSLGLETLELRFGKAVSNCHELAGFLESLPQIKRVNYPGKKESKFFEISRKQFGNAPGAMLTFDFSSKEECFAFMNRLEMIKRATNVYDNKTLILHPASTIYCDFSQERRQELQIREETLRLSLGIEDMEDIKSDILQALS
jgi:O-acetylhomoserine (thiol)-lyase